MKLDLGFSIQLFCNDILGIQKILNSKCRIFSLEIFNLEYNRKDIELRPTDKFKVSKKVAQITI